MVRSASQRRLDDLLARHSLGQQADSNPAPHLICIPAVTFAALGLLFAMNFGISLIAIAAAILYYSRFGERIAAPLGAILLAMLAVWMTLSMLLMPAHHLVAAALSILLAASAAEFFFQIRVGRAKPPGWYRQYLLAGPVYCLVTLREKLQLRKAFAQAPGFDPN